MNDHRLAELKARLLNHEAFAEHLSTLAGRYAWIRSARELLREAADAISPPTRFAWLMEMRLPEDSTDTRRVRKGTLVYWDGGHAQSFTTDPELAVQWCRRDDALRCARFTKNYAQWGWRIVEHGFTGEAAALSPLQPAWARCDFHGKLVPPAGPYVLLSDLQATVGAGESAALSPHVHTETKNKVVKP